MPGESRHELLRSLLEHHLDAALIADEQGRIHVHNTALPRLLGVSTPTPFDSLLRLGGINLQRLLLRAAITAGEQDAVGRPSLRPLDFRAILNIQDRPRNVRIRTSTVHGTEDGQRQRLRLITLHQEPDALAQDGFAAHPLPEADVTHSLDPVCQKRLDLAVQAVKAQIPLLLSGESGTGKSRLAHSLRLSSPNATGPVRRMFCGTLPDHALGAELLGHARGAFPGAISERPGLFESVHGGTLILEGLDSASITLQMILQRVLDDGGVERLGETVGRKAEFCLISTCREDPRAYLASGHLLPECYYRIAGITVELPPLRERPHDLTRILQTWTATQAINFTPNALAHLQGYAWPGNFRELEHLLNTLRLTADRNSEIDLNTVAELTQFPRPDPVIDTDPEASAGPIPGFTAEEWQERERLHSALIQHDGNRTLAARSLGMDRTTLWRKLHRLRLIQEPRTK